jgi:hypothetical protein
VFPKSDWNYGLLFDEKDPARSFEFERRRGALARNPFTAAATPVSLKARAKRIPNWQSDRFGMVGKLQPSPVKSNEKTETIRLIPMGAARLRVTAFPVIGNGPTAAEWKPPVISSLHASHVFGSDSLDAVNDGRQPRSSSDGSMPRFTWWNHRGTAEWIEWGFPQMRKISAVEVYWYDDTGKGSVRPPLSWRVLYRVGERWRPVEGANDYGTDLNTFNRVTFSPVECNGLRIEAQLQPNFSAGILEWKVE